MKLFLLLSKRYPITTLLSLGLTAVLSGGLLFSWPTLGLLKYALGFTAGFTPAEIMVFATQYVSAAKFWGELAWAVGVVSMITYQAISFFQGKALLKDIEIQLKTLNTSTLDEVTDKERINKLIDTHILFPEKVTAGYTTICSLQFFETAYNNEADEEELEEEFIATISKEEAIESAFHSVLLKWKEQLVLKINEMINAQSMHETRQELCEEVILARFGDSVAAGIRPGLIAYLNKYYEKRGKYLIGTQKVNEFIEKNTTPYAVLGVDQSATTQTIDVAYRKLTRLHHPDKNGGIPSPLWEDIRDAHEILRNDQTRYNLDQILIEENIEVSNVDKENVDNHATHNSQENWPIVSTANLKRSILFLKNAKAATPNQIANNPPPSNLGSQGVVGKTMKL